MDEQSGQAVHLQSRISSGVSGLDQILGGGLIAEGGYLIYGNPGTGKTTLGNQIAFAHAARGGNALYVTALTEDHGRMVRNLTGFSFFNHDLVGERIQYLSVYDELRTKKLYEVHSLLIKLVRKYRAKVVIVDGGSRFSDFADHPSDYRTFIADLYGQLIALGCTVVLLANPFGETVEAIATHADAIIELVQRPSGIRTSRMLQVNKLRGSRFIEGQHAFDITTSGVTVFPRLESLPRSFSGDDQTPRTELSTGIASFDRMLEGGLLSGSTTLVVGAAGSGKTSFGMHFMGEGARAGEPGMIVAFHDSAGRLIERANSIGLQLASAVDSGLIHIQTRSTIELEPDSWAHDLLGLITELGIRRLFVDMVTDVELLSMFPERIPVFVTALIRELEARGVTSMLAAEARSPRSITFEPSTLAFEASCANTIMLRYVERGSQFRRFASILKSERHHDSTLRAFDLTSSGVEIGDPFSFDMEYPTDLHDV